MADKSKKELTEENLELKERLRELEKYEAAGIENLPGIAIGLIKIDKEFFMAKIAWNPETFQAHVINVDKVGIDRQIATYKMHVSLVEDIVMKI